MNSVCVLIIVNLLGPHPVYMWLWSYYLFDPYKSSGKWRPHSHFPEEKCRRRQRVKWLIKIRVHGGGTSTPSPACLSPKFRSPCSPVTGNHQMVLKARGYSPSTHPEDSNGTCYCWLRTWNI